MLEIKGLKAGYNGMEILHGIDFVAENGTITAIIGPNGAGKSTLLKSIFNLTDIYDGKIIFKDKDITKLPTHDLIYEGVSFVPQGRQVFSTMTVRENLEMGAFVMQDKELVGRNLEEVYRHFPFLKDRGKETAGNFSGGQQQILAIARALMQNPQLLLMDEPSLGLSPKAMKEIFDIVVQLNKEGITVIIVEQNAKSAIDIAHQTYILEDGKIALSGGKEILHHEKIQSIYLGGR